ncbi:hypothetical protein A9Q84_03075 [Halobacteriovorax marinus]|uniref:Thiol-disulfide oxidoreductase n=1 Tax=Halobacteriovorax marinus TaxID=97084 RepID=A0A1Y5FCU6_9BACT|nr:hypothetical protein A9Q84_03075 [Halobacteriovorax marinus]
MNKKNQVTKPIIFFDGVCGLCNSFVNFILDIDKKETFLFSPLQGELSKELIREEKRVSLDSVVVWDGERLRTHSDAVLYIFSNLDSYWKFLIVFRIIPSFLRDLAYKFIASIRYKVFGKSETCRFPSPSEKKRFLP